MSQSQLPAYLSPRARAPRRGVGYAAGFLLAAVSAPIVVGLGYVAEMATTTAAAAVMAL